MDPRSVTMRDMLSGCADNLAFTHSIVSVGTELGLDVAAETQRVSWKRCRKSDRRFESTPTSGIMQCHAPKSLALIRLGSDSAFPPRGVFAKPTLLSTRFDNFTGRLPSSFILQLPSFGLMVSTLQSGVDADHLASLVPVRTRKGFPPLSGGMPQT